MYNDFRMDLLFKLQDLGLPGDIMGAVIGAVDVVSSGYAITKACTDLVVRGREELEAYIRMYLICKQLDGCTEATLANYKYHLDDFVKEMIVPLAEIRTNDIRRYLTTYKAARNISDGTLDKVRMTLNGFFLWAQNDGYINSNPMANIGSIKHAKPKKEPLTPEELETLRSACRTDRERALVETLYSTGCRITELINVKVDDVRWQCSPPEFKVLGKGKKDGIVYLSPRAVVLIKKYLSTRSHDSEWLFCNDRGGEKMSRENAEKIFRELRELAGLEGKKLTPHTLRHTMATNAVQIAPVQVVQKLLRHDKIETTLIYAETAEADVKAYHKKVML